MYTIDSLSEINQRFLNAHYKLSQDDVNVANNFIELIKSTRRIDTPVVGDIVRYTNKYGEYFAHAHIENVDDGEAYICERANSYIYVKDNNTEIGCSSSGGTWNYIPLSKMKHVGIEEKIFWFFGHCGACGDGGIDFKATVNVWECDLNEQPFSTKTHDCYYVSYNDDADEYGYRFRSIMQSKAWKTKKDFNAWLRTYRGTILPRNCDNQIIVWTYKEKVYHVSPDEYEALDGINDTILMNGCRMCKRVYDDKNYTVHTYYVWYWDDPDMPDFAKRATYQNKYRKRYECVGEPYENARREIASGKIEPIYK